MHRLCDVRIAPGESEGKGNWGEGPFKCKRTPLTKKKGSETTGGSSARRKVRRGRMHFDKTPKDSGESSRSLGQKRDLDGHATRVKLILTVTGFCDINSREEGMILYQWSASM